MDADVVERSEGWKPAFLENYDDDDDDDDDKKKDQPDVGLSGSHFNRLFRHYVARVYNDVNRRYRDAHRMKYEE